MGQSPRLQTFSAELLDAIVLEAARESVLWDECALPSHERQLVAIFSPLADERYRLGLETIYEAYLVHFGRPRLFAIEDSDTAVLLGDYLYAHGLVRIAGLGETEAVADLAELISLCGQLRAEDRAGDGAAWAASSALLGAGALEEARAALRVGGDPEPLLEAARAAAGGEAVERALDAHSGRVG
jgi:hypothetical protein